MPSLLEDMETYIIANGQATADGTDIFRDYEPDAPDAAVVLNEYAGYGTDTGVECVARNVQVVARAKTSAGARTKAAALFNLLDKPFDRGFWLTATRWAIISARQTPFKYKVDENGRVYYAFNLVVITSIDQ